MYPAYPHYTDPTAKPSSPTPMFQPWHYGGNCSYPVQHQYHGCCCYGGGPYGFWPPYTHYPPPPVHPHGVLYAPYPGPGPYPAAYSLPPQHYSVEQPRYEYDKNNHAPHHCCGYEKKEEPQVEKDRSQSLVPLLLKDHPIMWLPQDYMCESKAKDKEKYARDLEPSKRGGNGEFKDSHEFPIMWLPRDYMSDNESKVKEKEKPSRDLEPVKRIGNGEMAQDEQGGGGGNRFPFKIFWLPSNNDEVGNDTKENNLDQVANKGLSEEKMTKKNEGFGSEGERETNSKHAIQKVVPMKQTSANKEEPGSKHVVQKMVPVKQASMNKEETSSKHAVQKVIPVKQVSTNEEKNPKSAETIANSDSVEKTDNGSKASPKTPKLPPVCLRIDPLPRKKKSSRSPSPGEKGRLNESPVNSPKSLQVLKKSKDRQGEGEIKTDDHANKVEHDNLSDNGDVPRGKGDAIENEKVDEANKVERDSLAGHGDVPQGKGDENEKRKVEEKKNLSEHEAALIIQSVYRGFEVRKSQPLKKLRQIYEVKKHVFELRNDIQELESSSSTTNIDGKKKLIIGETIMSLLLKLDTIQGLHPFVREVRKSVAKELVGLQEKLDSLASVKSETPSEGRPQEVMHPEGDAIQEKSDQAQVCTGLCENHENTAAEPQYDDDDDAEACHTPNPEQQSEKSSEDDPITDKSHQTPIESDTVIICENEEVHDAESQQGCNAIDDLQLGLQKEKLDQVLTERDEAPGLCESQVVEAKETEEDANTGELQWGLHEEKLDQAPTERDEALGLCENREVEFIDSEEGCNAIGEPQLESDKEKLDQASSERDEALVSGENHEATTTKSEEGCNTIEEPQLESHKEALDQAPTEAHKEELDQAPTEALGLCENHEAEAMESQEGCNTANEPQLESHKEELDQEPTEALGSRENHEVEYTESQEGCNVIGEPQTESHKVELDQDPSKYDGTDEGLELCDTREVKAAAACVTENDGVEAHDMKLQHNSQEPNNNQLQMLVETDHSVQGIGVETMVYDSDACQPCHEYNNSGTETCDNNLIVSANVQMDDVKMMEVKAELAEEDAAKEIQDAKAKDIKGSSGGLVVENEKLRVAVEELMKAGNEQLGVIRELTGRVKDLEKKLSKKKKVKVNNKCSRRSRGCVVQMAS